MVIYCIMCEVKYFNLSCPSLYLCLYIQKRTRALIWHPIQPTLLPFSSEDKVSSGHWGMQRKVTYIHRCVPYCSRSAGLFSPHGACIMCSCCWGSLWTVLYTRLL